MPSKIKPQENQHYFKIASNEKGQDPVPQLLAFAHKLSRDHITSIYLNFVASSGYTTSSTISFDSRASAVIIKIVPAETILPLSMQNIEIIMPETKTISPTQRKGLVVYTEKCAMIEAMPASNKPMLTLSII